MCFPISRKLAGMTFEIGKNAIAAFLSKPFKLFAEKNLKFHRQPPLALFSYYATREVVEIVRGAAVSAACRCRD